MKRKSMFRLNFVTILVIAGALGAQAQDLEAKALAFIRDAGHVGPLPAGKAELLPGKSDPILGYTSWSTPEYDVRVHHFTRDIWSYANNRPTSLIRAGSPILRNADEADAAAREWLIKVKQDLPPGFASKPEARPQATQTANEAGVVYLYDLAYNDEVDGVSVRAGNTITVSINAISGDVFYFTNVRGFTYNRPSQVISESEALDRAQGHCVAHTGRELSEPIAEQAYCSSSPLSRRADPMFKDIWFERKSRLAYVVTGELPDGHNILRSASVLVDAETGRILNSHLSSRAGSEAQGPADQLPGAKSMANSSSRHPVPPSDKSTSLAWIGFGVAGLAGAIWLILRSRATP